MLKNSINEQCSISDQRQGGILGKWIFSMNRKYYLLQEQASFWTKWKTVFIFLMNYKMKDWTQEYNEAMLQMEEAMRRDPKQKDRDAERKKAWEDAVRAKHAEKLRADPKFAEEWHKTHPEDRPKE